MTAYTMGAGLTAESDDLHVELTGLLETDADGDETAYVFLFEVTNIGDEIAEWWHDEHWFVDDDGYQHEEADLIRGGIDAPEIDLDDEYQTHVEIVPDARVHCVTDVEIPKDRVPERIRYRYQNVEYEIDLAAAEEPVPTLEPADLGINSMSESEDEEDEDTDEPEVDPTASSDSFDVTLTNVVTDAGDGDSELTILTFDVENTGHETEKWWYDEHTFLSSRGYQQTEVGAVNRSYGWFSDISIEGYNSKPDIQPGATSRCVTDVALESDEHLERIVYDYSGESYEITLDEVLWEKLTVTYDKFEDERVEVGGEEDAADIDDRVSAMVVDESPDTDFDDIGGLDEQKRKVREAVRDPLVDPERFDTIGITPPEGVLLYGPPGTGKTMLARAVANDTGATFIKLAGPELARAYLGEGAELVRDCFEYARRQRPAIIFIDEIDAIAARRSAGASEGTEEVYRTMLQLLSEMDGFEEQTDVRVMAATNRINRLDDAILRPGRFDRKIEVPYPNAAGRREIFAVTAADMKTADDIDLAVLAERASEMSGAEIVAACTEAGYAALRAGREEVRQVDFVTALQEINQTTATEERDASGESGVR